MLEAVNELYRQAPFCQLTPKKFVDLLKELSTDRSVSGLMYLEKLLSEENSKAPTAWLDQNQFESFQWTFPNENQENLKIERTASFYTQLKDLKNRLQLKELPEYFSLIGAREASDFVYFMGGFKKKKVENIYPKESGYLVKKRKITDEVSGARRTALGVSQNKRKIEFFDHEAITFSHPLSLKMIFNHQLRNSYTEFYYRLNYNTRRFFHIKSFLSQLRHEYAGYNFSAKERQYHQKAIRKALCELHAQYLIVFPWNVKRLPTRYQYEDLNSDFGGQGDYWDYIYQRLHGYLLLEKDTPPA